MKTLEQALADRQAYFDSLPPERRAKALAYQADLDAEAAGTEGGMTEVIAKRLRNLTHILEGTLAAIHLEVTKGLIRKIAK